MFLDDDMLTLQLMKRIARYLGMKPRPASLPEQAMQMMVTFRPELVMVDMSLNKVNGLVSSGSLRGIEILPPYRLWWSLP
jgi:two-component SAPR family response regulator